MELAVIIATLIVVVILQIITIARVSAVKKAVSDQDAKITQALSAEKSGERRDRDFRSQGNRRPGNDQRPRPSTPPQHQSQQQPAAATGSVDTVEKSLRDINLKLKNAERDQEFARRKVQENFNKDPNRRNDRNDRNPRGGNRDNRDNRGDNRDNRGDNRDNRDNRHGGHDRNNNRDRRSGGNWQERNKGREPLSFGETSQNEENKSLENQNVIAGQEQVQIQSHQESAQVAAPVSEPSTPDVAATDLNTDDSFGHGRKILVKRRMLKEEDGTQSEGSDESTGSSESASAASSSGDSESSEGSSDTEIKFGRR